MKPNKRKWEELLEDKNLENRIQNTSQRRFQKERNRNRILGSFAILLFGILGYYANVSYVFSAEELTNNVSVLLEEFDSDPFLYLAED